MSFISLFSLPVGVPFFFLVWPPTYFLSFSCSIELFFFFAFALCCRCFLAIENILLFVRSVPVHCGGNQCLTACRDVLSPFGRIRKEIERGLTSEGEGLGGRLGEAARSECPTRLYGYVQISRSIFLLCVWGTHCWCPGGFVLRERLRTPTMFAFALFACHWAFSRGCSFGGGAELFK